MLVAALGVLVHELFGATLPKLEFRKAQLHGLHVILANRYSSFSHLQKERTKLPAGARSATAENELYSRRIRLRFHSAGTVPWRLLCATSSCSKELT